VDAFGNASQYMGMAPGNTNFSMGQNSLAAQKALQGSLMNYQGIKQGLGRQFQQQDFNSQMQPGVLGYLGAGVSALGAVNDVGGAFNRRALMQQGMAGMPGSPYAGPPSYLAQGAYH
jgi:hypothetical protein